MKKIILASIIGSFGMLNYSSVYAQTPPVVPVYTLAANLVCKLKNAKDPTGGFVASTGDYAFSYNGSVIAHENLQQILAHNPSWVASTGASSNTTIPCSAAVSEVQRYVYTAVVANLTQDVNAIPALLTNIKTGNPSITNLSDNSIVYNWVMAVTAP